MRVSSRHAAVLGELVEWWEDLPRTRSRCVLLAVPPRWGRSTVLKQLAAAADAGDAVSLQVRVDGTSLPEGAGAQAGMLRDLVAAAGRRRRVAELLGADRLPGVVQLGLGAAGLLASPPVAAAVLAAGIGIGAAGRVWDDSAAGQQGALARAVRSVAALSVQVPVLVTVDDADLLDQALAVRLVEGLLERPGGQVLVVAAAGPGGALARALLSRARFGPTEGRVQWRLLLALRAGLAGYPALTQRLLAPLLDPATPRTWDAAHALAAGYGQLGDYRQALSHAQAELPLRLSRQGPDHPDILTTRASIVRWTGEAGDPATALRLSEELLPDQQRLLGPDHPHTLATRANIEYWSRQAEARG